jgi:hypothetical protein
MPRATNATALHMAENFLSDEVFMLWTGVTDCEVGYVVSV